MQLAKEGSVYLPELHHKIHEGPCRVSVANVGGTF